MNISPFTEQALSIGFAILATVVASYITRKMQPKARVVFLAPHAFTFDIDQTDDQAGAQRVLLVHTGTLLIRNTGQGPAKDISICHSSRPQNFKIWPPCEYEETLNNERFHIIKIPALPPQSEYAIEMLSVGEQLPTLTALTFEGGHAKFFKNIIQPVFPKPVYVLVILLMFLGASLIFYGIIQGLFTLSQYAT